MKKRNPLMVRRSSRYGNHYIIMNSIKDMQLMAFESELEYLAFLPFETNGDVIKIEMHPKIADIVAGQGVLAEEIPNGYLDMKITWRSGDEEYIEVKYADDLKAENESKSAERARRQVAIQKAFCEEKGLPYRIVTDEDLHLGSFFLSNLIYIRQCLAEALPIASVIREQAEMVFDRIRNKAEVSIRDLQESCLMDAQLMQCIAYLFYSRRIDMDLLSCNISGETKVRERR